MDPAVKPLLLARLVACFAAVFLSEGASAETTRANIASRQSLPDFTLSNVTLPEGFSIAYYTDAVPLARSLVLSPSENAHILYVSTRQSSVIYAVVDSDFDGTADEVHTITSGLNSPNGVAYQNGSLFVAETNRILRYDDVDSYALRGQTLPAPVVVSDAFPSDWLHGWKYIAFGPDGKLYVPVGAPCNVCSCESYGSIGYCSINRMNADGTGLETFATGVRNTVGFDWHPGTGELWFTDNGRDNMGDNIPDCELNRAPESGLFFGFPYCHTGGNGSPENRTVGIGEAHVDPDLNFENSVLECSSQSDYTWAVQAIGPHTAPLGMKFYTGAMFPATYQNAVFIAEHGSWNRAEKIGYRLSVVKLDVDGVATSREAFAEGWLQGQTSNGRPVDVLVMPDGALLVSDDQRGAIYRITYSSKDDTTFSGWLLDEILLSLTL